MTDSPTPGLRERKRAETRAQLEKAAVEIALSEGPEHATVDAISAAANVSARTFFNYFDSKEDAILGVQDSPADDETIDAAIRAHGDGDAVGNVIGLLFAVLRPSLEHSRLQKDRMELIHRNPKLLVRQVAQMTRMSEQLTPAIARILARARNADTPTPEDASRAEVVLAFCGGAFRQAMREWLAAGGEGTRKELEHRANTLVHEVRENLK